MNANVDELIKALSSGAVLINNLTINVTNNTADTIINGDGATVNRITATAQPKRPLLLDGVEYKHSHCEPLDAELHGNVWGWGDTSDKETDYYNRVYRQGR